MLHASTTISAGKHLGLSQNPGHKVPQRSVLIRKQCDKNRVNLCPIVSKVRYYIYIYICIYVCVCLA